MHLAEVGGLVRRVASPGDKRPEALMGGTPKLCGARAVCTFPISPFRIKKTVAFRFTIEKRVDVFVV